MKYKNESKEILEIPWIWKILPWTFFECSWTISDERIILIKENNEKETKKTQSK